MPNANTRNTRNLTLAEIASWQIANVPGVEQLNIVAGLPALQRGAVWKPRQIEEIWDSIMRCFPIGAFLISPFDEKRGRQDFKHQQDGLADPTHHLLDGQQRATAIALGYFDPWKDALPNDKIKSVLWIDLGKAQKGRDVEFVFRSVTRSHPWGYLRSDPNNRISENQIRMALEAFRKATPSLKDERPGKIPLTKTWPLDAEAPIPLAWMIEAVVKTQESAKTTLWQSVQKLPLMTDALPRDEISPYWLSQRDKLTAAFEMPGSEWSQRLDQIIDLLRKRLIDAAYSAPIMILPKQEKGAMEHYTETDTDRMDAIETLFVRINSAGTPLEGEELIYSLIKSAWIEAPESIGKLTYRLATPARIALFSSRLVMARIQAKKDAGRPSILRLTPTPGVTEFRRLMYGLNHDAPSFFKDFQAFVKSDGLKIFETARIFLISTLPPVLATELAQKSPDVFFIFLRWLDRLMESGIDVTKLKEKTRLRCIGFLTALAWFAKDKNKAVDAIWNDLQRCEVGKLESFFSKRMLEKTYLLDARGNLRMVPLLTPDDLEKVLAQRVTGHVGCRETITEEKSDIWNKWNWWEWLISENRRPKKIGEILAPRLRSHDKDHPEVSISDRVQDSWYHFMETLWGSRSILLFAQRDRIIKWFDDFDPSLPEFLEDKNRPWDYDHIHPQNFLRGKNGGALHSLPQLIKDWHNSIGNLRAWPLEANRSDSDSSPASKLEEKICDEEKRHYFITDGVDARAASFISNDDWEKFWKDCTPKNERRYLTDKRFHKQRKLLVHAIIRRFVALYREWYDKLLLADLNG